jgi:hypothetical protein
MTLKEIAYDILLKEKEIDAVILEIFETGSQLFLQRETDLDYVVICRSYKQRRKKNVLELDGKKYDILFIDEIAVAAALDFDEIYYVNKEVKIFNYYFERNIRKTVYGDFNINWSMLDHKDKYLAYIKDRYLNKSQMPRHINRWKMGKSFVPYYIILNIYKNNKVEVTPTMLADIQQLYSRNEASESIIEWIDQEIEKI